MHELTVAAQAPRRVVRATWWVPLVQGLTALAIGLMLWTRPGPTLVGLTMFLGAYWLLKEGGFLGIGGTRVSQAEEQAIAEITAAVA